MKKSTFILLAFIYCSACTSISESEKSLVGDWDVQWVTTPEEGAEAIPGINYTMNGKMLIQNNGKLTIKAFGYDNCIFQRDSTENTLDWRVSGDTLFLKNADDEFEGMPYVIKETATDKIKLQLVEDIYLFLTR